MDIYQDYEEGNHVVEMRAHWRIMRKSWKDLTNQYRIMTLLKQAILIGQVTKSKAKYKSCIKYLRVF